ncbi:MAG: SDR family NAD(P)-dependent oxidoreductase [Candidatus Heimdallarchaeota archaeon]|nr:SDR family NAD(P)-dependent oxidoreductase [Candidatus Heimdallarchaeota archaeon]
MTNNITPILITGADTGIGRLTAEKLAQEGYTVYAGCYQDTSINELNDVQNIIAVKLDVTNQDDIDNLVKWIEEKGNGLYGLVNNAGIGDIWPLIESSEKEFHRVLNINLYGVFRVTNAVMPFLVKSKGRILSMGSLSGTIPTKFIGPYSVSKFGVEAYADVLHFETRKFGIHSITIKPGNFKTDITKANAPLLKSRKDRFEQSDYKEELGGLYDNLDNPDFLDRVQYEKPYEVVETIIEALFTPKPKLKYLVTTKDETESAIGWMFRVIAQLNQNHPHGITNEKLHDILDQQLAKFV